MNCPTGFLWYQKEENQFFLNESQTPDGWAPLPVSVNPKDLSRKDLTDLAEALSKGSQYAIYVDQNSTNATDAKDNRGQSSLRPFRSLERALIEAARRSFRVGQGGQDGNDITDRISIYLASGIYDVDNGFGGDQTSSEYNRRQDAATLLIANKDYLVQAAYDSYQNDPVYALALANSAVEACKRDLSFFVEAVADDIAASGNLNVLRAAKMILTETGFIPSYGSISKRESTLQALRTLRDMSRTVIKNQAETTVGGVRLPYVSEDVTNYANPCQSIQMNSNTLYEIIIETLASNVNPWAIEVNPGTDTANFPTEGEPTSLNLRSFNSVYTPGIILPRGVSIIGADLRKVIIRPKYVPDAHNANVGRSAIFRMTGGNYFSGFTVMDKPGLQKSHHKLTCFEFCNFGDLSAYYNKVALAFEDSSKFNRLQDAATLLQSNIPWIQKRLFKDIVPGTETQTKYLSIFEAEIPSMLSTFAYSCTHPGNKTILDYANRFKKYHIDPLEEASVRESAIIYYSSLFMRLEFFIREAISNRANTTEGGLRDDRIIPDASNPSNPCQDVQSILHTLVEVIQATMSGIQIPEVQYEKWSILDSTPVLTEHEIVGRFADNPVGGASPYIYSASLRSRWGMCGIDADGNQVSGFKSFVAAQFTVISMQSDPLCFTQNDVEGEVEKRYLGTRPQDTVDYRHFGYRVREGSYAQLVSCFCIAPAVHYWNDSGGEFSITNSTSNFGDISLYAHGFLDNKLGGGAYPQDRGHRVIGLKKPANFETIVRTFVLGYIKPLGTTLINDITRRGTITLTNTINTQGYKVDDPEYPTLVKVKLPGGATLSAEVISLSTATNGETTLEVTFNDNFGENWRADDQDPEYRRGLIGASLFFERFVDSRLLDDKFYKLIIEKAESTVQKKREPLVNYILRKGDAEDADDQPFNGEWDVDKQRGRLYYVESVKPTTDIAPRTGKINYELTLLCGYVNLKKQMEYSEDSISSVLLDRELDRDPRYGLVRNRDDSCTLLALQHIFELLEIEFPAAALDLSVDRILGLSTEDQKTIEFNKPSVTRCTGQTWEYVGYYNYDTAIPSVQPKKLGEGLDDVRSEQMRLSKTQTQHWGGRIYATGMDEEGSTYSGNKITDLKTGDEKTVNLGTSLQVEENYLKIDYEVLNVETLSVEELAITGDVEVGGDLTAYDITVINSITSPLGTFDNLRTTGENIYMNVDATQSNTDWLFTLSQSSNQSEDMQFIFPPNNGENRQVLTNQGQGITEWAFADTSTVIISVDTPTARDNGTELEAGDLWFDPTDGAIYITYSTGANPLLIWVQVNEMAGLPITPGSRFPGISPGIPTTELPINSNVWNNGDTELYATDCLEMSLSPEGVYTTGPLSISNGLILWTRWKSGTSCGGSLHNTSIKGQIHNQVYFVDGAVIVTRVPTDVSLTNILNDTAGSTTTSNTGIVTGHNYSFRLWGASNGDSPQVSIDGGAFVNLPATAGSALPVTYAETNSLRVRHTNRSAAFANTSTTLHLGESDTVKLTKIWHSYHTVFSIATNLNLQTSFLPAVPASLTFVVNGNNPPYTYKWYRNGSLRSTQLNVGSTTSTFTINNPSHGDTYYVMASDADAVSADLTSAVTTLSANTTFNIVTNLTPTTSYNPGASRTLTFAVNGNNPPYTYKWYRNGALVATQTNVTSTVATYVITTPTNGDAYYVTAQDSGNISPMLNSTTSTLSANLQFIIVTDLPPQAEIDTLPLEGGNTFTIVIAGNSPPYTYRWYVNGALVRTNANLTTTSNSFNHTGYLGDSVYVTIEDSSSSTPLLTSTTTLLTGVPYLRWTLQPPTTLVLSRIKRLESLRCLAESNEGPVTYQWYRNGIPISGATSTSRSITLGTSAQGNDLFRAIAQVGTRSITTTECRIIRKYSCLLYILYRLGTTLLSGVGCRLYWEDVPTPLPGDRITVELAPITTPSGNYQPVVNLVLTASQIGVDGSIDFNIPYAGRFLCTYYKAGSNVVLASTLADLPTRWLFARYGYGSIITLPPYIRWVQNNTIYDNSYLIKWMTPGINNLPPFVLLRIYERGTTILIYQRRYDARGIYGSSTLPEILWRATVLYRGTESTNNPPTRIAYLRVEVHSATEDDEPIDLLYEDNNLVIQP